MIKVERYNHSVDKDAPDTIFDEYAQANSVYFQENGDAAQTLVVQIEGVYHSGQEYKEDIEVAWYGPGSYIRAWREDLPAFTTQPVADNKLEDEDDGEIEEDLPSSVREVAVKKRDGAW